MYSQAMSSGIPFDVSSLNNTILALLASLAVGALVVRVAGAADAAAEGTEPGLFPGDRICGLFSPEETVNR